MHRLGATFLVVSLLTTLGPLSGAAAAPWSSGGGGVPAASSAPALHGLTPTHHQVDIRQVLAGPAAPAPRRETAPHLRPAPAAPAPAATPQTSPQTAPRVAGPPDPVQATQSGPGIAGGSAFAGLHHSCTPPQPDTCGEPPDPTVAVGPNHIVQAVNLAVRITDRSGGLIRDLPFPTFFAEPAGQAGDSDPHVLYDQAHQRWLATELSWACSTDGSYGILYLGISRTADPTTTWDIFQFRLPGSLPDYPGLGTSSDKVAVTWNAFALSNAASGCLPGSAPYQGSAIGAVDWAVLMPNSSPVLYHTAPDPSVWTWRAAVNHDPDPTIHAVATKTIGGDILSATVTGSSAAQTVSLSPITDLTQAGLLTGLSVPPEPAQIGGTVSDAVDARITDAIWGRGRLWFVTTTGCTPTGDTTTRDCVRVVGLDTTGPTPTVADDFLIADVGFDDFMGGIGLDAAGILFIVYSQSSSTTVPASVTTLRWPNDPPHTVRTPLGGWVGQTPPPGLVAYKGTRWGDYVVLASDPLDPLAVWEANEYADTDGTWATSVRADVPIGLTYTPISPVRVADSRIPLGLSGILHGSTPASFQVAGFQVQGAAVIPADAQAVTGNVTVVGQSRPGYVSLTPTRPSGVPSTSTINFPVGDIRANGVTVPLGPDGRLWATYRDNSGTTSSTTQLVFDVTGYFSASGSYAYAPISPVRVADSRSRLGLPGPLTSSRPASFPVAGFQVQGAAVIPADATAVTGNVTVVGQSQSGYVSVTPTMPAGIPSTSTINFPLGDTRANGVTVPLGPDGKLWVTYSDDSGDALATTQLIFDVTGYFTTSSGLTFDYYPLGPIRIADSRIPLGFAGKLTSSIPASTGAGPAGARFGPAMTGNVTVVGQQQRGYVAITPAQPSGIPSTSTINFPVGDIRANGVTGPFGSDWRTLWATYEDPAADTKATTDLVIDLTGVFRPSPP